MSNAAIIVAGGRGQRAGGSLPKQRRLFAGKPVFSWSLAVFESHPEIDFCVLVVPSGMTSAYEADCAPDTILVEGGDTRTASVRAGLDVCAGRKTQNVLIHDAARPGVTADIIAGLIEALESADAAAPALSVVDALKRQDGEHVTSIPRDGLYRVQTPQAFDYDQIRVALAGTNDLVDDLAAIEARGGTVKLIDGLEQLAKITYPEDHTRLEALLMPHSAPPRFGTGFDVHAFAPGDAVTLCGIAIPHTQTLAGHSDADVAWHALTDAILGAAALGDIGDHFPPTDSTWKGVDSSVFLSHAVKIASQSGWQLSSCDVTIICEAPKVHPHREAMRRRTAEITGLALDAVSVKATTTEGLGFTGRREGIAAQASVVLSALQPAG